MEHLIFTIIFERVYLPIYTVTAIGTIGAMLCTLGIMGKPITRKLYSMYVTYLLFCHLFSTKIIIVAV